MKGLNFHEHMSHSYNLLGTQNKWPVPAIELLNVIIPLKKNRGTGFQNLGYFLKLKNFLMGQVIHNTFYFIVNTDCPQRNN